MMRTRFTYQKSCRMVLSEDVLIVTGKRYNEHYKVQKMLPCHGHQTAILYIVHLFSCFQTRIFKHSE